MTDNAPLIVFSGTHEKNGQTTLALNIAAALWQDKYQVLLAPQNNSALADFVQKRKEFAKNIFLPQLYPNKQEENQVVIADIGNENASDNMEFFNNAHTLITVINTENDIEWSPNGKYLNFVWNIKKNQAAHGRKYLNWIVVPNLNAPNTKISIEQLKTTERKFGYRLAPTINYRKEYQITDKCLLPAEMVSDSLKNQMTFAEVYARREILELAGFIWQPANM